jgi:ATP-dependent Clp protease adaptor protein ClpS
VTWCGADEEAPGVGVAEPKAEEKVRLAPRYKVFIHNDPVTPMEFVVVVLVRIFTLEHKRAIGVMMEAHTSGVAFVGAYSLEQAEFRVEQAHSLARTAKYPLTFTYEPE